MKSNRVFVRRKIGLVSWDPPLPPDLKNRDSNPNICLHYESHVLSTEPPEFPGNHIAVTEGSDYIILCCREEPFVFVSFVKEYQILIMYFSVVTAYPLY